MLEFSEKVLKKNFFGFTNFLAGIFILLYHLFSFLERFQRSVSASVKIVK